MHEIVEHDTYTMRTQEESDRSTLSEIVFWKDVGFQERSDEISKVKSDTYHKKNHGIPYNTCNV